jgi:hypothetical protein
MSAAPNTYTAIRNEVLEDARLSPVAFRVLLYLASKPPGWVVRTAEVMKALRMTEHAVAKIARPELVRAKYLVIEPLRTNGHIVARDTFVDRRRVVWDDSAAQTFRAGILPASNTALLVKTEVIDTTEVVTESPEGDLDTDEISELWAERRAKREREPVSEPKYHRIDPDKFH